MKRNWDFIEKNRLELDDTFDFRCKRCGECCHNRNDLLLTSCDIFRIARFQKITLDKVIAKNCEVYIGEDSRIPVAHVLPKAYRGTCPFLRNGECSVHTVKPVVCAVFPLARMHTPEGKAFYALQETTCGDKGNVHTVREWLREFNIPDNDAVGKLWSEAMIWCVQYMQRKKIARNEEKNEAWNRMFFYLYIFFNIHKPFEDQLRTNFSVLKSLLTNGKEE